MNSPHDLGTTRKVFDQYYLHGKLSNWGIPLYFFGPLRVYVKHAYGERFHVPLNLPQFQFQPLARRPQLMPSTHTFVFFSGRLLGLTSNDTAEQEGKNDPPF